METTETKLGWSFWGRWVIWTSVAWVVGMLAAIFLSYLVVNLFYPKETNLIVGICMGAAVGLAQMQAARPWVVLGWGWVWGAVVAMGLPFVLFVIFEEMGIDTGIGSGMWLMGALVTVGGVTGAFLQAQSLRATTTRWAWWIPGAMIAWGVAWPVDGLIGFPAGALAAGAVGGALMIWVLGSRR